MIQEKPRLPKKSIIFLVFGLLVYIIFLLLFVDLEAVIAAIQSTKSLYYLLAFVAAVVSVLFHALIWMDLLKSLSIKTSFPKVFSFWWIGILVDALIPAESVSGEFTRAYLMNKEQGGNAGKITASVISHRVIYTFTSLIGLFFSSTLYTLRFEVKQPLLGLTVVMILGATVTLFFLFILCLARDMAWKIVNGLFDLVDKIFRGRWHVSRLKPKARKILDSFYDGINTLANRQRHLALPVIFSVGAWLSKMLILFFVLVSINIEVPLSAIVMVFSLSDALQNIPIGIPGEVGVIEIAMTALFTAIGIPPALSATATILTRVVTMWFSLFIGAITVQWIGIKLFREEKNSA